MIGAPIGPVRSLLHRRCRPVAAIVLGCALGCGPVKQWTAPAAVGPAPDVTDDCGHLVVYSADDAIDTADAGHPRHRRYVLLAADEAPRTVLNQSGPFGQDPDDVCLSPGEYTVETSATNFGRVRVPVVIERGRTTVLHLDGDDASDPSLVGATVDLPNGKRIGARSSAVAHGAF